MEKDKKIVPIIEYQAERQRTPEETIDFLLSEIASGKNIDRLLILYSESEDQRAYICASKSRNYNKASVLWDMEQWKIWFLEPNN
jgi:hypothetical protein